MEILAKAPRQFVQHVRNERSVTVGGRNTIFVLTYGSPFVRL
jgi:trimethylamine:corrinoid methyltransferase-like protein